MKNRTINPSIIMTQYMRILTGLFIAATTITGIHAQQPEQQPIQEPDTTRTHAREHVQFNALDHVLQKGFGNEHFQNKKFGDRLFITADGGFTMMHTKDAVARLNKPKFQIGISVGDWLTPVHGVRLGINGGEYGSSIGNPKHYGISADYLMNFSALVRKDNPDRTVEVIGLAGCELQMVKKDGNWSVNPGFRIGIQTRFNVSRSTFLYIEPRIGIYTDNIDAAESFLGYDYQASLMVGLGYRLNGGRGYRTSNSTPFHNEHFVENLFYGFSAGATTFAYHDADHILSHMGPVGSAFVGKQVSSVSAFRLSASIGYAKNFTDQRSKMALLDLDYQLDIPALLSGYDPDRLFHTKLGLGAVLSYAHGGYHTPKKLYPGLGVSLQGAFRLNDNLSLFIEPKARFFARAYSNNISHRNSHGDILASLSLGLQYQINGGYKSKNKTHNWNFNLEDYLKSKKYFISLGGGSALVSRRGLERNVAVVGSLGKWFSPISAWRVGFDYDQFMDWPRRISLSGTFDYMMSLSSLSAGYDPDRLFDLSALVGVSAGASHKQNKYEFIMGGRVGLHGRFRLSPSLELFIEPQLALEYTPDSKTAYSYGTILAGITYRMGNNKNAKSSIGKPFDGDKRNFVQVAGGMSFSSENVLRSKFNAGGSIDASVGRWLSRVSGVRVGVSYDFVPVDGYKQYNIGTAHINYMANLRSLFNYDPDNIFHIIAELGAGLAWNNNKGSGIGGSAEAGLQFRWNLPSNIDLLVEPTMILWEQRMCNAIKHSHRFVANGRVMAGIAYRF